MNEALENWNELEEEKKTAAIEKSKVKRKFETQEQTLMNANSVLNKVSSILSQFRLENVYTLVQKVQKN